MAEGTACTDKRLPQCTYCCLCEVRDVHCIEVVGFPFLGFRVAEALRMWPVGGHSIIMDMY